jgi:hypothetical protein
VLDELTERQNVFMIASRPPLLHCVAPIFETQHEYADVDHQDDVRCT